MHDLTDANGHDNLGFNGEGNNEADTTSHHTTITNVSSNNGTPNGTPRNINGISKKTSKKNLETTQRSVSTEVLQKRKSMSESTKETSFNTRKKSQKHANQNKETLKYAGEKSLKKYDSNIGTSHDTKELRHSKGALKKTKNKTIDQKDKKRKISIQPDQNAAKDKEQVGKGKESSEEKLDNKKKVKIKESLSQKIKKSNSTAKNKLDKTAEPKSTAAKPQQNTEGHKRNVKYLLDQAMEANKESNNIESCTASILKDNESRLESSKDNIRVDDQDKPDTTKNSNLDGTRNVNFNIGMQENDDSKVRRLERVETDDCTSIDTSTLPPPPDEILLNSQEVLSESHVQERFIA